MTLYRVVSMLLPGSVDNIFVPARNDVTQNQNNILQAQVLLPTLVTLC